MEIFVLRAKILELKQPERLTLVESAGDVTVKLHYCAASFDDSSRWSTIIGGTHYNFDYEAVRIITAEALTLTPREYKDHVMKRMEQSNPTFYNINETLLIALETGPRIKRPENATLLEMVNRVRKEATKLGYQVLECGPDTPVHIHDTRLVLPFGSKDFCMGIKTRCKYSLVFNFSDEAKSKFAASGFAHSTMMRTVNGPAEKPSSSDINTTTKAIWFVCDHAVRAAALCHHDVSYEPLHCSTMTNMDAHGYVQENIVDGAVPHRMCLLHTLMTKDFTTFFEYQYTELNWSEDLIGFDLRQVMLELENYLYGAKLFHARRNEDWLAEITK